MDLFPQDIHSSQGSRSGDMLRSVLLVLLTTALSDAVIMAPPEDVTSPEDGLGVCLKDGGPVLPCLNAGALEFLEEANQKGGVEVLDGLELVQDDGQSPRSIVPLGEDWVLVIFTYSFEVRNSQALTVCSFNVQAKKLS